MRQSVGALVLVLMVVALVPATAHVRAGGIQLPRLVNPPPPREQVAEAQIWDPYPMPDQGPYADGTRPRDFLYPPPMATRGRYPAPGTFPRPAPQVRSTAPADYSNLKKWWVRKQHAKAQAAAAASSRRVVPDAEGPALVQPAQPAEEIP